MRVLESSSIVYRPSERLSVRTINPYGCIDRHSRNIFAISFVIYLVQKLVPDFLIISYAYFTVLGNLTPNLYNARQ